MIKNNLGLVSTALSFSTYYFAALWLRGFTEIGYVPESRVIFKKSRWCPFFPSLFYKVLFTLIYNFWKRLVYWQTVAPQKSLILQRPWKWRYIDGRSSDFTHPPLCQHEVPIQSPTVSHFESFETTDDRSAIWGCDLAGSPFVNPPPFARTTTHPRACSHAPSLFASSVIRSVALHSVAFFAPSIAPYTIPCL